MTVATYVVVNVDSNCVAVWTMVLVYHCEDQPTFAEMVAIDVDHTESADQKFCHCLQHASTSVTAGQNVELAPVPYVPVAKALVALGVTGKYVNESCELLLGADLCTELTENRGAVANL